MTRLAWHEPAGVEGARTHFHDQRGLPVCGAGWFPGRRVTLLYVKEPLLACARCAAWLAAQREAC